MRPIFLFILALIFTQNLYSKDFNTFKENFELVRNDDGERIFVDKKIRENNSFSQYILNLSTYLKTEEQFNFESCPSYKYEKLSKDVDEKIDKIANLLKKSEIGKILASKKFISFVKKVESLTEKIVLDKKYPVMANVDNSKYFFKYAIFKTLKNKLIGIAKKSFEATVYLNLANFIIDDYIRHLKRKKTYRQNAFMYYLLSYSNEDFQLSKKSHMRAITSIYESRISPSFKGIFKSIKIRKYFTKYGTRKIRKAKKNSKGFFKEHKDLFGEVDTSVHEFFIKTTLNASPIFINLKSSQGKIRKKPSIVFDKSCSDLTEKLRRRYEVIRIAFGVIPIPFSGEIFKFIKALYSSQSIEEGFLYGYFLDNNMQEEMTILKNQSVNPFLVSLD